MKISDEIQELITASTELLGYASNRWKPIETAPKDGTYVLVYGTGLFGDKIPIVANFAQDCYFGRGGWASNACIDDYYTMEHATHWMPLPNPPVD
jgi:hypothetical protein